MNTQVFDAFNGQSAMMMGPTREISKLAISKLEQLVSLQFSSMRDYAELNIGQLKAAAEISGPQDVQGYVSQQQEFVKTVGEKLAGDVQAMVAIGKEFTEEVQKIAFGGMSVMPQMPAMPMMGDSFGSMMPKGLGAMMPKGFEAMMPKGFGAMMPKGFGLN